MLGLVSFAANAIGLIRGDTFQLNAGF